MVGRKAMLLVLAGAGLSAAPGAWAQPVTGPYVSLGGGGNYLQDERTRQNAFFPDGKLRFDAGGAVGTGAVGYGFGNGFRVEIEGDWRYNGLQHLLGTPFATRSGGEQQNYGAMANALFDMDVGANWIYPYFGAGAGYSFTRWDHIQSTAGGAPPFDYSASGTYGNFAYQGIFGLSFPMPFLRGLSLTAEYRFFSVLGDESFHGESIGTFGAKAPRGYGVSRGNTDITTDFNHSALLGLRYALFTPAPQMPAAAPPPAAPPPEVQPSRTYLVFFDWDRADLSGRARQIVAEAAAASTHVQTTRIEVNGYTDLSGTASYNQGLSVRRAESVEAELVRDGVTRGEITIRGYGESHPLVPTAKGVREPQNRRVEIILH